MSAYGPGNFENDTALGAVHALLAGLFGRVEKQLSESPTDLDGLHELQESVMADIELAWLIAGHVFRSAAARAPVWLPLLPPRDMIVNWKTTLLALWGRVVASEDSVPALDARRQTIADSLDRLADLAAHQEKEAEPTFRAYWEGRAEKLSGS